MNLIVIDTETSDLKPSQGAQVIEIAWLKLIHDGTGWVIHPPAQETYIQYSGPISPLAQASHHIRLEQLTPESGAIKKEDAIEILKSFIDPDTILVAHNAEFDAGFLPELQKPWLCTMRCAKRMWPQAPGHSNQALRYWLDVKPELVLIENRYPHQALYDVATTTGILLKMLEQHRLEDLLLLQESPLQVIGFGKHKGMRFNSVPRDYLQWLRRQDIDNDLKHTIDSILR